MTPKKPATSSKFRVLPLLIFTAALLLSVRIGELWRSVSGNGSSLFSVLGFSELSAQQAKAAAEKTLDDKSASVPAGTAASGQIQTPPSISPPTAAVGIPYTQTEIELLHKLAEKREALDEREREIDQKIILLEAAQKQLDMKIKVMKDLEASMTKLVKENDTKEKEKIESLVKTYSSMKPKDAARLMDEMDLTLAVRLIAAMKESKVAPILAAMSPQKAGEVTEALAVRKKLLESGETEGCLP